MAFNTIRVSVLSLAFAYILWFAFRLYERRQWFMNKSLPQPPHSFLWGHLKIMAEVASTMPPNMHPQAYFTAIALKYNLEGIFYLDLWPVADSQVILTDPGLMTRVTVKEPLNVHQMADDFMAPIVGRNVVAAANGATWKRIHNAMAPAFSTTHIRSLTVVFIEEITRYREVLDRHARTGDAFSFEDVTGKLVFDIIGRILFNSSLHAQTEGSVLLDDLRQMIQLTEAQLSNNPFVKMSNNFKRKAVLARLNPAIESVIKARFSVLRREKTVPSRKIPLSILDLMLREHVLEEYDSVESKTSGNLAPHYLELLKTNVKGLLLGGHGTTTTTLCFAYMLLSKHPEVLRKLRDEHTRVFHRNFTETVEILLTSPQKATGLEYTVAVIKETLRLFPVGFGVRKAEQGAFLTYNNHNYPIDNNLVVIPLAHSLHYSASHYPEPTKFCPERFLDPNDNTSNTNMRAFGRGARACLGQGLAMTEMSIILLMTVRDFNFACADLKPNAQPRTSFTDMDTIFGDIVFQMSGLEAKPRGGMMMNVSLRV